MDTVKKISFVEFMPVSLFGGVMGLCGLCFSWRLASIQWNFPSWIADTIGTIAILAFILLTAVYLTKLKRYPALVKQEYLNPATMGLFATFIISLLLLPGVILPYNVTAAITIWCIGTVFMFLFALVFIRRLIDHQQEFSNALPVWILPVVGTLDVPIVGLKFPFIALHEICNFFFGVGILFSIILITIVLSRLVFTPQLSKESQPTLLILVGPFALAFSCYLSISGTLDLTAKVFYYFDLFILILLFSKLFLLPYCCPFKVSWWSVSFPLAALTIASLNFAKLINQITFDVIALTLLLISTCIIGYLLIQTLTRVIKGQFQ